MREAGAADPRSGFEVGQVPIDGHPDVWMNLSEQDWAADPFPGRYVLIDGRLPTTPGEVAISHGLVEALGRGPISLAGGGLYLTIVGVIRDDANRAAPLGLVAPGTWNSTGLTSGTFDMSATRLLYWSSEEPPLQVVKAIASVLNDAGVQPLPMDELLMSVTDHRAFHAARLYSELGVLILLGPIAAGLIGGWSGSRFVRRIRDTLLKIGIPRTALAGATAIMGSALFASLVGVGIGLLAGVALRPLLDAFSNRWLGPIYGFDTFVPLVVGAMLVGSGLGMMNIVKRVSERPRAERRNFVPSFAQLLPAISLLLVFVGVFCAQHSDLNTRFLAPYIFGSAVVILAPLALGLARRVRTNSLPVTLAFRQLGTERRGASWVTVGLASLLMLSFSTLLVNYSVVATANEQTLSRVPEGQAQLTPPPSVSKDETFELRDKISDYVGVADPVSLGFAAGRSESGDGPIMIVQTPRDVERLLGVTLQSSEIGAMEKGALLRFKEPSMISETVQLDAGGNVTVPVVQITETVASNTIFGGLITQATADRLQMLTGHSMWVYADVSEEQLRLIAEAPSALGFDPRWLVTYEPPMMRTEPPVTLFMGFSAGLLASLLVAYYSSTTTRNLRPTLAALHAVGVRPKWLTTVSMAQLGVVILTAAVFAWLGAVIATLLSTQTWITSAQLHIPWASVGLLLATLVAGALISQLFAARRLSYIER